LFLLFLHDLFEIDAPSSILYNALTAVSSSRRAERDPFHLIHYLQPSIPSLLGLRSPPLRELAITLSSDTMIYLLYTAIIATSLAIIILTIKKTTNSLQNILYKKASPGTLPSIPLEPIILRRPRIIIKLVPTGLWDYF